MSTAGGEEQQVTDASEASSSPSRVSSNCGAAAINSVAAAVVSTRVAPILSPSSASSGAELGAKSDHSGLVVTDPTTASSSLPGLTNANTVTTCPTLLNNVEPPDTSTALVVNNSRDNPTVSETNSVDACVDNNNASGPATTDSNSNSGNVNSTNNLCPLTTSTAISNTNGSGNGTGDGEEEKKICDNSTLDNAFPTPSQTPSPNYTVTTASISVLCKQPERQILTTEQINSLNKDEIVSRWLRQDKFITSLQARIDTLKCEVEELRSNQETEERLKAQLAETQRREQYHIMRLASKENELQELGAQVQELKSVVAGGGGLKNSLLDPAINLLFERLKRDLDMARTKMEETQNELSAWKFTPDSNTGKQLMAKCRLLIKENDELGRMISSGRLAKLEGDLALQRNFSEELKKSQSELDEFLLEMDEDTEGMQGTILYLQQQLRQAKEQIAKLVAQLSNNVDDQPGELEEAYITTPALLQQFDGGPEEKEDVDDNLAGDNEKVELSNDEVEGCVDEVQSGGVSPQPDGDSLHSELNNQSCSEKETSVRTVSNTSVLQLTESTIQQDHLSSSEPRLTNGRKRTQSEIEAEGDSSVGQGDDNNTDDDTDQLKERPQVASSFKRTRTEGVVGDLVVSSGAVVSDSTVLENGVVVE